MQCLSPIRLRSKGKDAFGRYTEVPCGKCAACITNKRGSWYFRLLQEYKNCVNAYFLTLTYDENNLPRNSLGYPTFDKEDIQKFFKRLRKACEPTKIRYFLASEYGSKFGRPHYHAILFDLPQIGDAWRLVHKCWGKGRTSLSRVTLARLGYVANYMYGHYDGPSDEFIDETNNTFMLCSRHPAIGSGYLTPQMVKYHKDGYINHVFNGKISISLPRYYRDKIFTDEEKRIYNIKTQLFIKQKQKNQDEKDHDTDLVLMSKGLPPLSYFRAVDFQRKFFARVKHHKEQKYNLEG